MASVRMGSALRQIHGLFEAGTVAGLSDGQLLERYLARRDESAFAALVMRHGPMVLGVCHAVLHGAPEVEDAFQATFLILIRKAGTIRGRDAVGGWLHRVAHRVAIEAGRDRSRRHRRERETGDLPDVSAAAEGPGDEDWRVPLHEELARLPERLRQPLVLCYLEGKTHAQAALELRWSEATLRRRLADARGLLRARLTRRGVPLSGAALAAAMASDATAAVPPGWVDALARGAAGPAAPAAAVRLAGKVIRGLLAARARNLANVATLLVAAGLVAGHLIPAGPARAGDPARPAAQSSPSAARPTSPEKGADLKEALTVRGRVLDPDGRPFAGAMLSVPFENSRGNAFLDKGRSGPDGQFRFHLARSEFQDCSYDPLKNINVAATADGFGLDWGAVPTPDGRPIEDADLTLKLVKDVPIAGRILSLEGKPVAGARLKVDFIRAFPNEDMTASIEGARNGLQSGEGERLWFRAPPGRPDPITTDELGRFRMTGAGRDRLIRFELEGPGIQSLHVFAATREPAKDGEMVLVKRPNGSDIHMARFDYMARPSRPIRGFVREKGTGRPVAGAVISTNHGETLARARTDDQGRFELLGYPKSPEYEVTAIPAEGQPFFSSERKVADTAGLGPIPIDFELARGIVVRGRITDGETGKPVKGNVEYYPLAKNPRAKSLGAPRYFQPSSRSVTDAEGNYAVVALPGPGALAVAAWGGRWDRYLAARIDRQELKRVAPHAPDSNIHMLAPVEVGGPLLLSNYNELKLISPSDGAARPLHQDINLRVGRTILGRVLGPDGKPMVGVRILGGTSHLFDETISDQAGAFSIKALDPERNRPLNLIDASRKLGSYAEIRGDQPGPLTIRLQPCGSAFGRIVDEDGRPLKDHVLVIHRAGYAGPGDYSARTDAAGRFRVEGLVPGQLYVPDDSRGRRPLYKGFTVAPGEARDLGEARVQPQASRG